MEKISYSQLRDIHPELQKKLLDTVKRQSLKILCPACGASFGANSLRYWLAYSEKTCGKCKEKTQLDFSKIRKYLSDIENM